MVEQRGFKFPVEGEDCLRGWLFLPPRGAEPLPAISVAHGYAGFNEHGLRHRCHRRTTTPGLAP
jgi:uncharacterized protein